MFPLQLRRVDGRRVLQAVEVESATISYGPAATGCRSSITDYRGTFRLYGLAPGDYLIVVRYAPQAAATVARHQTNSEDIARAETLIRTAPSRGAPGLPAASSGLATPPTTVAATPTDFTGFAPVTIRARSCPVKLAPSRSASAKSEAASTCRCSWFVPHRYGDDHRPNGPAGDKRRGAARERLSAARTVSVVHDSRPPSGRFSLANIPPGRYRLELAL